MLPWIRSCAEGVTHSKTVWRSEVIRCQYIKPVWELSLIVQLRSTSNSSHSDNQYQAGTSPQQPAACWCRSCLLSAAKSLKAAHLTLGTLALLQSLKGGGLILWTLIKHNFNLHQNLGKSGHWPGCLNAAHVPEFRHPFMQAALNLCSLPR